MPKNEINDDIKPELVQRFIDKFRKANITGMERNSKESLDWFRKRISKDTRLNRMSLINNHGDYRTKKGRENSGLIGHLFYFQYEAESAGDPETGLFDEFPMVFIFNTTKTKAGKQVLWGLNLHYAKPAERAMLYLQLLRLKTTKGWSDRTKLKMTWKLIQSVAKHSTYEKCVHAYRIDRMKTRMVLIEPEDWEVAVFLQLQKWKRPTKK